MIFQQKIFLILYYITDQILLSGWLPLLPEILGNMCIAIVC